MIELRDVEVALGGITLLAATSASVRRGETLTVRGRNGAGKSTLLRVLAGVRAPTSGTAHIGGIAAAERDPRIRRSVAAMIGLPPMAADLTVRDHVAIVATSWLDEADAATRLTEEVLTELELEELGERFPHELSSGQTQLFGLALVLARPFEVLILDEPEQRLDPERLELVIGALRARREAGATLVLATHSAQLADALGQQTLWLGETA